MNVLVVVCLTMYKSYFMDITVVTWDDMSLEVYCTIVICLRRADQLFAEAFGFGK